MEFGGQVGASDSLDLKVTKADGTIIFPFLSVDTPPYPKTLSELNHYAAPRKSMDKLVNDWRGRNYRGVLANFLKVQFALRVGKLAGVIPVVDSLYLTLIRSDGEVFDLGIAAIDLITTAGANYMRDGFVGTVEPETIKYHGLGTGTTGPVIGDTALQTEWANGDYTPSTTRANGAYTAPQSKRAQSVATNTKLSAGTSAVTEYAILSSATPGAGTMLARFTFAAVNLGQNDALTGTFNLDFNDGG